MNSLLLGFFSFLFAMTCSATNVQVSLKGNFTGHFIEDFYANLIHNFFSTSYSGTVAVEKGRMSLKLESPDRKLIISPATPEVKIQLSKLKSGDFLSVEGTAAEGLSVLYVRSVNHVGLKDLVGNWVGDDEYCYKFNTFYVMSIYNKTDRNKCDFSVDFLAREFGYFINPAYPDWSVLLSDNENSYLMDLILNSKKSAELSLYDSRSGDILRQIRIRR